MFVFMKEVGAKKTITLVKPQTSNVNTKVQQWGLALGKPNARPLLVLFIYKKAPKNILLGA